MTRPRNRKLGSTRAVELHLAKLADQAIASGHHELAAKCVEFAYAAADGRRISISRAAASLPRFTVFGLRFLDLANAAVAAGDATAARRLTNLAQAVFGGLASNVMPLPVAPRRNSAQHQDLVDSRASVA